MKLFSFGNRRGERNTAALAKERLQIIVAREGNRTTSPSFLPQLQQEILALVRRYIDIDERQINVTFNKEGDCEVLEVNIPIPERPQNRRPAPRRFVPPGEEERSPQGGDGPPNSPA